MLTDVFLVVPGEMYFFFKLENSLWKWFGIICVFKFTSQNIFPKWRLLAIISVIFILFYLLAYETFATYHRKAT